MSTVQDTFIKHGVDRADLAKQLGITIGAVWQWKQVPAARVLEVERITNISRHVLRPDVFGEAA